MTLSQINATIFIQLVTSIVLILLQHCYCWLPNTQSKLINNLKQVSTIGFIGNNSFSDYFVILYQDDTSILVGGRNKIYNLSIFDFKDRKDSGIIWKSSEPHEQLCILKGKSEDDCQNYLRILFHTPSGHLHICGTNSYKPLCREYESKNGKYVVGREYDGKGLSPYDPEHNSTAIYSNEHLFSATVADFSGGDPLIYREPLRTELSDLKQLNAPNFVTSMVYEDYIYYFFRETAVEFMNCGKAIYSRVARVCKHDKGGPHQSRDRWTTFLKARLNCSVPGEYPFYFNEIQSSTEIIEGKYGNDDVTKIIYAAFTTPDNAIGGSAVCIYRMQDILDVFEGAFKHQDGINSNWLPVPENLVPSPRPGECSRDSRILPDKNVNFIKNHPLMEDSVAPLFGKPILIRVSLHYRFTAIIIDFQVPTQNDQFVDVMYIGTDDGKVLKVVNIPKRTTMKTIVISENEAFTYKMPVKQLKLASGYGKIIAVGKNEVRLLTLNHCNTLHQCKECVDLRDPHCAWDKSKKLCVSTDTSTTKRYLIQDIFNGDISICNSQSDYNFEVVPIKERSDLSSNFINSGMLNATDASLGLDTRIDCNEIPTDAIVRGCAIQSRLVSYTSQYLHIIVASSCLLSLVVGFVCGYFVSRRFHTPSQYLNTSYIEQHNHLDRHANQNSFLTPRANKTVNLDNVSVEPLPPKKDNLGSTKNLNITNEGTLQKIKKTYI